MNPTLTHLSGARTGLRFVAVSVPMLSPCLRMLSLRLIPLVLLGAATLAGAAENPGLRLTLASSGAGVWRPGLTLAFRVTLEHPSVSGDTDTGPWTLNPGAGWAGSVTLQVKGPAGQTLTWPFARSALRETEALRLPSHAIALVGFTWDPDGPDAAAPPAKPGHYEVRARLAASDGTGWQGQVESQPVALEVLGPIPPVVHLEAPVTGTLYQGWPWGMRVWIELPDADDARRLALPGGWAEWGNAVSLEVRDGQGRVLTWPLVPPRQWPDPRVYLEVGQSTGKLLFRMPAASTPILPPGQHQIVAKFARTPWGEEPAFEWSGVAESTILEVTVMDVPSVPTPEQLREQSLLETMDGLGEAENLRIEASRLSPNLTPQRIETIRKAAAPLLRAEKAAQRLYTRNPDDSEPALVLAAVMRDQDDKAGALAWARMAEASAARRPLPPADQEPGAPDPVATEDWVNYPELLLRQSLEELPEVPDEQLTPELRATISALRGEEPELATLEEKDRFFGLDPNGQWASSAMASSEYRAADYSASRATGAPDVTRYGDAPKAWASRLADAGEEWLELTFPNEVRASAVRVRQVFNPGAIIRVQTYDASGVATTVFSGVDTNTYAASQIAWFIAKFPRTSQPVQRVRLTLDSARVKGWNEIDAVQLVTGPEIRPVEPTLGFTLQAGSGAMQITGWPAGFVLQRATRLAPSDWQTVATAPPITIQYDEAAAFFRLLSTP